jgi:hypothetical protein
MERPLLVYLHGYAENVLVIQMVAMELVWQRRYPWFRSYYLSKYDWVSARVTATTTIPDQSCHGEGYSHGSAKGGSHRANP